MAQLDSIIHQPVRLQIMSSLGALGLDEQVDFACLRNLLKVTDGNLGAHLSRLEEAGYIRIDKAFVDRKPKTFVSATDKGRDAFAGHVGALEAILRRPTDRAFLQAIYKRPPGF